MVDVRSAQVDVKSRNDDVSRQDDTSIPSRFVRLGFPRMLLPALMFTLIVGIWYAYLTLHCVPLLQLHKPPTRRVQSDVDTGLCHFFLLTISVILLITSYGRAIFVLPGYIPDTPEWAYVASDGGKDVLDVGRSLETKVAGGHRHCRKCVTPKYKPDRAHHCRVCKTCVLRMDHHCPWIYNCVGFYNYKYFFLLLLYSAVSLHIVAWTFWITMVNLLMSQPYGTMEEAVYVALFVETFAIAGSLVFTVFCGYHIWLIVRGMSTIEHIEKYESAPLTSMWSLGVWNNVRAALGANAALWFLPCSPAVGNGLKFESKVKFE